MNRYCPNCGMENLEPTNFCKNCGSYIPDANFENKINTTPQNYIYKKPSRISKPVLAIIAIAVVAVIILVSVFVIYLNSGNANNDFDSFLGKIKNKVDGGPTANLQSLSSGQFQSIPEEGRIAKYYLYYGEEKIGEISFGTIGQETYNGKICYKVLSRGDVELTYASTVIAFQMDIVYYSDKNSKMPVYMTINYDYSKPDILKDVDISMSISWNQDSGEISTQVQAMGQSATGTAYLPNEYWGMISSIDDLYVGFLKEFNYNMVIQDITINANTKISVTGQENVVVPNGEYNNCYVVEYEQTQTGANSIGTTNSNMKIWISEEGIVPQAETSIMLGGNTPITITQKLEGYYTTI